MDQETELSSLGFWPPEAIKRLAESWIATAEQVLAVAATEAGVPALAEQTGLPEGALRDLLERTRAALPASERARLSRPADTSKFGTGARRPADKRDDTPER